MNETYQHLPPIIQQIYAAIGENDTLKFIECFAGRYLYIPINPKPGQILTDAMGVQVASKIIEIFPAKFMTVPLCKRYRKYLRDKHICELWETGHTIRDIVQETGLTSVTIRGILKPKKGKN